MNELRTKPNDTLELDRAIAGRFFGSVTGSHLNS